MKNDLNYSDPDIEVGVMQPPPVVRNFVSPYGDKSHLLRRDNTAIDRMTATVMNSEVQTFAEIDGNAIKAMQTVSERSTPTDRAYATAILGLVVLLAILGMTLTLWLIGATGTQVGCFFVLSVAVSIVMLLWLNAEYSPIGGERYKAKTYKQIRQAEIKADIEKSKMKFQAFVTVLEKTYGGDQ